MSIVDVNAIISGTPDKRILLGYRNMKDAYNEDTANEFYNTYTKESLSSILDNSQYIFSECYKGTNFYKDIVLDESSCIFTRFNDELDKVSTYFKENSKDMKDDQKEVFESLINDMNNFKERYHDIFVVATYINENESEDFEETLSNLLYEKKYDDAINFLKNSDNEYSRFIYAPFIAKNESFNKLGDINNMLLESTVDLNNDLNYDLYTECSIVMNKANACNDYNLMIGNLHYMPVMTYIRAFAKSDPIPNDIKESLNISDVEMGAILHEDSDDVVNSVFDNILEASLFEDLDKEKKDFAKKVENLAYEKSLELLTIESSFIDNGLDHVSGYKLASDNSSYDDIFGEFTSRCNNVSDFFESSDEDDDDDIDSSLDELSDGEDNDSESDSNKKRVTAPPKPKAKNIVTKIQTKAQDLEVKQMGRMSKIKQASSEVGRAVKAVATLPLNVIRDIKQQIRALEEKDIERRKAYMTKPGYRHKAFRNLKLAIMYGTAAQIKLSMVPTLAIIRHFSKQTDTRVRQELIRELATEVKVCEAKIDDAQNNNDSKEKYRLIRLRDQLEAERMRVIVNSKKM